MIYPAMRQCPICEKFFIIQDFSQVNRKYCYECSPQGKKNDYVPLHHAIKRRLIELKGGKCEICGYDKCEDALHFHHKDPTTKKFNLSEHSNSLTWENYLEESKKCQLLCANCHAEIHYQKIKKKEKIKDNRVFESPIQELLENDKKQSKKTIENYCIDCGKKISYKAIRCQQCDAIQRQVATRPSRETLKNMIRTTPFTQIAKQFNVSDRAISKWCKAMNLPYRKKDINNIPDQDWFNI